ncbi:transcriptional regulator [Comamonas serinivorans]|uniref:Transcriptional regulator n=1 Tax=Comamonas serinivorans TaxID=1082851 RepID=A0A1Y0EPM0_9BURK|nr:YafY family protein [Comamonas serinivorans]ARU05390.1 transcriptional regulator [Comamonas serinivorans]
MSAPRSARLLTLLDELHRRRRPVQGAVLATRLGISLRTLYRDIDTLRAQGAEIDGEPGIGYLLRAGHLLPAMMFSAEELEAVVLGTRWVAAQGDAQLAVAAQAALDRIVTVLPPALRLQVETSGLFAPQWGTRPAEPWVATLRQAIRDGHRVRLQYADAEQRTSERVIWPFAMAFLADKRLLAAWCELRQGYRHFRADRVLALDDLGQPYPRPRHDLLRDWQQALRTSSVTADRS